jgi:hypothetical protein
MRYDEPAEDGRERCQAQRRFLDWDSGDMGERERVPSLTRWPLPRKS